MGSSQSNCPNTYYDAYGLSCTNTGTTVSKSNCEMICTFGVTSGSSYQTNWYDYTLAYFPDNSCCTTAKTIGTWLIVVFVVVPTLCIIGCVVACVICCRRRQEALLIQQPAGVAYSQPGGYQQPMNSGQDIVYQQ